MASDIVVYTAITKDYDELRPPHRGWLDEARFVAFLEDQAGATLGWEVQPILQCSSDPCRNAKVHKILPQLFFPDAQYSLWIDGSILITATIPLKGLIADALAAHDMAVYRHRKRDCIYDEAAACISTGKDSADRIAQQIAKYRSEGYPAHQGLAECCVLLRRHTMDVERFNCRWYSEICNHSRRDQLSFDYVCSQMGVQYLSLPGSIANSRIFRRFPHTKTMQLVG
jgi:TOD1/MUCI70, glycosyltransferase-like domain